MDIPNYDMAQAFTNPTRSLGPAIKWRPVTFDTTLGSGGRWLLVEVAGTIDYVAGDNDSSAPVMGFPVADGYHFMLFYKILSTSTATGLWWSD